MRPLSEKVLIELKYVNVETESKSCNLIAHKRKHLSDLKYIIFE